MERLLCLLAGYVCGGFLTAELVARHCTGKSAAYLGTGNPGMAKGGSGDVLAGMAGAFLAQGVPAFETAVLAVYLHGLAGDVCAQRYTQRAMLPTDLPQALPQVFRRFL